MPSPRNVTVFGSGQFMPESPAYQSARRLGYLLAQAHFIVYNGGYGGVMAASAQGAKEGGGKTVGITAQALSSKTNPWIDEETKVPTWKDRLFTLIEKGDAYVFLDGGTGTLTELFVVWEMTNKEFFSKPILLLGEGIKTLADGLRQDPCVRFADVLRSVRSPEEAVNWLKDFWGKATKQA